MKEIKFSFELLSQIFDFFIFDQNSAKMYLFFGEKSTKLKPFKGKKRIGTC